MSGLFVFCPYVDVYGNIYVPTKTCYLPTTESPSKEQLKQRKVILVDIAKDLTKEDDDCNPTRVKFENIDPKITPSPLTEVVTFRRPFVTTGLTHRIGWKTLNLSSAALHTSL